MIDQSLISIEFVSAYYYACSEHNKLFEYQALPKELYDVFTDGNPSTRISSSAKTQDTKTTHVTPTVVATTSSKDEGKTSSSALTPQSSAVVPTSTTVSSSNPLSEAASVTPNAQPTDAGSNSQPSSTVGPVHPDGRSDPTHIHTTIHVYDTGTPTSNPSPSPLSTPKIAAISAASGLTFLALTLGATLYLLRRRRRARMVGAWEGRWDPSRGLHSSAGKICGMREAKLPDVDIDAGKAVGVGEFEKGAMAGVKAGSGSEVEGVDQTQSELLHEDHALRTTGTVLTELETRSPTDMTMAPSSVSAPTRANSYGSERMWPMNGASEVHAESAGMVSPVVSELEGAHGTGRNARYNAAGR